MKKIIAVLPFLLLSLCGGQTPAFAYQKPDGVPTAYLPDYTTTISVWAISIPGIGDMTCVFDLRNDGTWGIQSLPRRCTTSWQTGYKGQIDAAGGTQQYLTGTLVPQVNQVLANEFPPFGNGSPLPVSTDPLVQINSALGISFTFKVTPNGTTLAPK